MSFLSGIGDLLKQATGGTSNVDEATQNASSSTVAGGLEKALGSEGSGGFGQMAAQLFSGGNSGAQAGMLGSLLATAGPAVLAHFASSHPGSPITGMLQQGQTSVTPEQAASVDPSEVQSLAEHVHSENPGIVGTISNIYAQHPTAIKALGASALAIAMKHISENKNG